MSYSLFNALFLTTTYALFKANVSHHMLPMAICSTYATVVPWYASIVAFDMSLPEHMMRRYGWSRATFILGDVILHVVPLMIAVMEHINIRRGYYTHLYSHQQLAHAHIVQHCGLYSLLLHLLWPFCMGLSSFNISPIYVDQPCTTINQLWSIAVITHMLSMLSLVPYLQ
ncbi:MAG: hypothetical protein VKK05_03065, partial [Synechococcus sp.]|nr:hypothetical protein [Synechococcus sp.]